MKKIITIAALALTLAACSNDDGIAYTNEEIKIKTTIGAMTKTALDEKNATQFVAGDQFMLYACDGTLSATNTPWINGVNVTLGTDNKWTPASQILWKTEQTSHDFLAIYPSSLITTGTDLSAVPFTINDNVALIANDILRAYSPAVKMPEDNVLNLPFKHLLAKLKVNLTFRNQWDEAPTVASVTSTLASSATINFYDSSISPADGITSSLRTLTALTTPATGYTYSYETIAVPNDANFNQIVITIDGKTYTYTYTPEDSNASTGLSLVSGKITTVNLIVGRNKVELDMDGTGSGSGSETDKGITISEWTDNTNYSGNAYGD